MDLSHSLRPPPSAGLFSCKRGCGAASRARVVKCRAAKTKEDTETRFKYDFANSRHVLSFSRLEAVGSCEIAYDAIPTMQMGTRQSGKGQGWEVQAGQLGKGQRDNHHPQVRLTVCGLARHSCKAAGQRLEVHSVRKGMVSTCCSGEHKDHLFAMGIWTSCFVPSCRPWTCNRRGEQSFWTYGLHINMRRSTLLGLSMCQCSEPWQAIQLGTRLKRLSCASAWQCGLQVSAHSH